MLIGWLVTNYAKCCFGELARRGVTPEKRPLKLELKEASTHKSAKTHAGNVSVTRDLDF